MALDDLHITVDNADYKFLTKSEIATIREVGQVLVSVDQHDYTPYEIGQMLCLLTRDIEELHILADILRSKAPRLGRSLD
jgi:hypothetical protein